VLLARAISVRWPGERMVILTPCRADQPGGGLASEPDGEAAERPGWANGGVDALVAATQSRLIYQERLTHTGVVRAIAFILATVAVATLFFGDGLVGFAIVGTAALVLWSAAKIAALITVGHTSLEFGRVESVDHLGQRIQGTVHPGTTFRLRVPDSSDFRVILSLLNGYGRAMA